jgi:hypothetical protein
MPFQDGNADGFGPSGHQPFVHLRHTEHSCIRFGEGGLGSVDRSGLN